MQADGVFIYGTLREGGTHRRWLERTHPEGTTPAYVPGRLFHLPDAGYPAMVLAPPPDHLPPGPGWVTGEFIGYEDEEDLISALSDLDQLEETETGLYERRLTGVLLASGVTYAAWVYVFPEDRLATLARQAVELPEGDWAPYLRLMD